MRMVGMENIALYNEKITNVIENINQVMIGKEDVAIYSLAALLAQGHVLLEDVPGVGKTMLVRTLENWFLGDFNRIHFLQLFLLFNFPVISIFNRKEGDLEFRAD